MEIKWLIIEDEKSKADLLIADLVSRAQKKIFLILTKLDVGESLTEMPPDKYILLDTTSVLDDIILSVTNNLVKNERTVICIDFNLEGITGSDYDKQYEYITRIKNVIGDSKMLCISTAVASKEIRALFGDHEFKQWDNNAKPNERIEILDEMIAELSPSIEQEINGLINDRIDCHRLDFESPALLWVCRFTGYRSIERFLSDWQEILAAQMINEKTIFSESLKETKDGNLTVGLLLMLLVRLENMYAYPDSTKPIIDTIKKIGQSDDAIQLFTKVIIRLKSQQNKIEEYLTFENRVNLPDFAQTLYHVFCISFYSKTNRTCLIQDILIDRNSKIVTISWNELGTELACNRVVNNIQEQTKAASDSDYSQLVYKIPNDKRQFSMSILKLILDSLISHSSTRTSIGSPFSFSRSPGNGNKLFLKINYQ